jgi:hypothetical protein
MFLKQTAYKPKSRTSSQSSQSTPPLTPADAPNAAGTTNPDPKPRTNSQTWEDRRFMWQTGTGRKSSFSAGGAGAGNDAVPAVQKPSVPSPFAMTKPNTSENPHPTSFVKRASTGAEGLDAIPGQAPALRDRHVIWSKGREVHEGAGERRKVSG